MGFHDDIKEEMRLTVYDPDGDESEEIVVKFDDGGVTPDRTIQAVVDRPAPNITGQTASPEPNIQVLNDVTYGVTSEEIDSGKTIFMVAKRYGQTPVERTIKRIERHDEAEIVIVIL